MLQLLWVIYNIVNSNIIVHIIIYTTFIMT